MSNLPLVSVITPSYNQGQFIEETILSVLNQDYPNIEHLIIDGGSSDNTLEILKKYDGRLSWVSEPDKGQTDAINKGFRKAKGEIICWLNSDDTYEPGAIRKAVEYMSAHPDVMLVYGEGNEIAEDGRLIQRFPATQQFDLWALIYIWDYILQPTTFFRKSIFETLDLPDTNLHWCMDWDLWIRIGMRFKVAYIDYVFANSRIYANTKTSSGGMKRLGEIAAVMRKYGKRKYPLGVFLFGVDTFETMTKQNLPKIYALTTPLFHTARVLLNKIMYSYKGLYADNWLGDRAYFMYPLLAGLKGVTFKMELLQVQGLLPMRIKAIVNDSFEHSLAMETAGTFDFHIPVAVSKDSRFEIEFMLSNSFSTRTDRRKLSCLLHDVEFIF